MLSRREFQKSLLAAGLLPLTPILARAQSHPVPLTSMMLNFSDGIFERNGVIYPDFATFMSGTGSALNGGASVADRTKQRLSNSFETFRRVLGASLQQGKRVLVLSANDRLVLNVPEGITSATVAFDNGRTQTISGFSGRLSLSRSQLANAAIRSLMFHGSNPEQVDVTSADNSFYSAHGVHRAGDTFVAPANKFNFFNNVFGRGNLVNGVDYVSTLKAKKSDFPKNALLQWDFPSRGGSKIGAYAYAYGYPAILYGATPFGDSFKTRGPWPQRVDDVSKLTLTYDVEIGGNIDSFNVLLDMYVTEKPDSTDGTAVKEMSFFPYCNARLPAVGNDVRMLSIGAVRVGLQDKQMHFVPVQGNAHRSVLSATVDLKEIFAISKAKGWITGREYLRGAEFGVEIQVPARFNSAPHKGWMRFKTAPVWDWV